jgi:hypothetical protein
MVMPLCWKQSLPQPDLAPADVVSQRLGAWVRNAKPTGGSIDAIHHERPKSQKMGQSLPGSRILSFFLHKRS